MAPLTIPDLVPYGIGDVPAGPTGPNDPRAARRAAEWTRWAELVLKYRDWIRGKCDQGGPNGEAYRQIEAVRCTRDVAYFVTVWCAIHESRPGFGRTTGWQPAIPYPFQIGILRALERSYADLTDLFISKSRDMGATWMCMYWALHGYLFRPGFIAKCVSRSVDLVHQIDDIDSMLERAIQQLRPDMNPDHALPAWMLPRGLDCSVHSRLLSLRRPDSLNAINGEATTQKTGRGGRATVAIEDEHAFWEKGDIIHNALGATVAFRVVLSSESVEIASHFQDLVADAKDHAPETVLELDYWMHPLHDEAWLRHQRDTVYRGQPHAFLREVMRQPYEGLSTWAYPTARDRAPGDFPYPDDGSRPPVTVSIDPGRDDDCALGWFTEVAGRARLFEAFSASGPIPAFYADLIEGYPNPSDAPWLAELKAFLRTVRPTHVVGDPAGSQRHATDSFYDEMDARFAEIALERGAYPLAVLVHHTNDIRHEQFRRLSLMEAIPTLDWHDTPRVRQAFLAVKNARWEPNKTDRMTEQKALRHDQDSHYRTMQEYWAAYRKHITPLLEADFSPVGRTKKRKRKAVAA